jgi:hypothetical protein
VRGNPARGALCALISAVAGAALIATPAAATFHEISIREVYAGSAAQPGSQYVELQMWSSGQHFVAGHSLKTYGASGVVTDTATFASMVSAGANQSTILLATPEAETEFGVAVDKGLAAGALSPSGGAACWEALDCVAWGNFSGSLPSPAGSAAAAIPDGMALRRTISPGCATLLEAGDDHDNSAADFSAVFPAPRPNSVAPSERACPRSGDQQSEGSGGGGAGSRGAPQTTLRRKPPRKTRDRTPTFRFGSDESKSTFQCKLDSKPFKACRSPFTTKQLTLGQHTFRVRARDDSGKLDPTPASYGFKVITPAS